MRVSRLVALVVLVTTGGVVMAQDKVENPMYTNWAKYKVGTSITMKTTTSGPMFSSESSMTTKLLEVTADKVVVETTVSTKANGMEFKAPATKQEYAKSVEVPKGTKKIDPNQKPEGTINEGTETIKIGGMDVKTKWYEFDTKVAGVVSKGKMWMSDDVPGSLVKMETKVTAPAAAETKMELVEFKKP